MSKTFTETWRDRERGSGGMYTGTGTYSGGGGAGTGSGSGVHAASENTGSGFGGGGGSSDSRFLHSFSGSNRNEVGLGFPQHVLKDERCMQELTNKALFALLKAVEGKWKESGDVVDDVSVVLAIL